MQSQLIFNPNLLQPNHNPSHQVASAPTRPPSRNHSNGQPPFAESRIPSNHVLDNIEQVANEKTQQYLLPFQCQMVTYQCPSFPNALFIQAPTLKQVYEAVVEQGQVHLNVLDSLHRTLLAKLNKLKRYGIDNPYHVSKSIQSQHQSAESLRRNAHKSLPIPMPLDTAKKIICKHLNQKYNIHLHSITEVNQPVELANIIINWMKNNSQEKTYTGFLIRKDAEVGIMYEPTIENYQGHVIPIIVLHQKDTNGNTLKIWYLDSLGEPIGSLLKLALSHLLQTKENNALNGIQFARLKEQRQSDTQSCHTDGINLMKDILIDVQTQEGEKELNDIVPNQFISDINLISDVHTFNLPCRFLKGAQRSTIIPVETVTQNTFLTRPLNPNKPKMSMQEFFNRYRLKSFKVVTPFDLTKSTQNLTAYPKQPNCFVRNFNEINFYLLFKAYRQAFLVIHALHAQVGDRQSMV